MPDSPGKITRKLFRPWEYLFLGIFSLTACAALGGLAAWMDLANAEKAFNREVEGIQRELAHRFGSAEAVLTTLVGLQQASDDFNKHEFQALARELLAAYPYIRTISEIGVMPRAQRGDFEQSMRDDGFWNFRVKEGQLGGEHAPAADRPVWFRSPTFSGIFSISAATLSR